MFVKSRIIATLLAIRLPMQGAEDVAQKHPNKCLFPISEVSLLFLLH